MDKVDTEYLLSNLREYLESHGINTNKLFNCLCPEHSDRNASMKFFDDNRVYCFGCGANYNLIDVISAVEHVDLKEAYKKAIQYYGRGITSYKATNKLKQENKKAKEYSEKNYQKAYGVWRYNYKNSKDAQDYISKRGISQEIAKKFQLGFNSFDFGEFKFSAVIIPVNKSCFTARNIVNDEGCIRYYKPKGSHIEMFNVEALNNEKPYCVLTEGEFDCLSFETVGINSMALCSANNVNKFIQQNKDLTKTYILALDNDEAGKLATDSIIDYFEKENILYKIFDNCKYKDANQALISDKDYFEIAIKEIVNPILEEKEKEVRRKARKQNAEM